MVNKDDGIMESKIITDRPQSGGLRKIREEHKSEDGRITHRLMMVEADYDAEAGLLIGKERAIAEREQLESGE